MNYTFRVQYHLNDDHPSPACAYLKEVGILKGLSYSSFSTTSLPILQIQTYRIIFKIVDIKCALWTANTRSNKFLLQLLLKEIVCKNLI